MKARPGGLPENASVESIGRLLTKPEHIKDLFQSKDPTDNWVYSSVQPCHLYHALTIVAEFVAAAGSDSFALVVEASDFDTDTVPSTDFSPICGLVKVSSGPPEVQPMIVTVPASGSTGTVRRRFTLPLQGAKSFRVGIMKNSGTITAISIDTCLHQHSAIGWAS